MRKPMLTAQAYPHPHGYVTRCACGWSAGQVFRDLAHAQAAVTEHCRMTGHYARRVSP